MKCGSGRRVEGEGKGKGKQGSGFGQVIRLGESREREGEGPVPQSCLHKIRFRRGDGGIYRLMSTVKSKANARRPLM